MSFEKRRQRDDESIDQFLENIKSLRRSSEPEETTKVEVLQHSIPGHCWREKRRSKNKDGNLLDAFKRQCATSDETRQNSLEYLQSTRYSYSPDCDLQGAQQISKTSCNKPKDDKDEHRLCSNCGSADHILAECTL